MRNRQVNRGLIDAVLTPKHPDVLLYDNDIDNIHASVIERLNLVNPAMGIRLSRGMNFKEIYTCHNLESYLWFNQATSTMEANFKKLKPSIINDETSYYFYTRLPVPFKGRFHRYEIPMHNDDFDTASWVPTEVDGHHVIYRVDLLSACLLYNKQYVLDYHQTNYELALMCELD